MPGVLTPRDRQLLETLTLRVRVISVAQAARTFWGNTAAPEENASRRISSLERAGYVARFVLVCHPELGLESPTVTWKPGEPPPDFAAASYRLKTRWSEKPKPTPVVIATEAAANWLGGYGGRRPRPSEASHDLHVAALYLRMLRDAPGRARAWQSEAQLLARVRHKGGRLPDAMIVGSKEKTVLEFGGAYSAAKLGAFHRYCAERGLPYEVW